APMFGVDQVISEASATNSRPSRPPSLARWWNRAGTRSRTGASRLPAPRLHNHHAPPPATAVITAAGATGTVTPQPAPRAPHTANGAAIAHGASCLRLRYTAVITSDLTDRPAALACSTAHCLRYSACTSRLARLAT